MKYIITEEIESANKVSKYFDVFDLMFVICYMAISYALASMVSEKLLAFFMIFSLLMSIALVSKSPFNRNRRTFESIYFMLSNDREVYSPIYIDEEELYEK